MTGGCRTLWKSGRDLFGRSAAAGTRGRELAAAFHARHLPLVPWWRAARRWRRRKRIDDLKRASARAKNFPVLIHLRYILESIRPEIQQYFIEADESQGQVPFTRAMRSTIYQRAKGAQDTRAVGTRRNVYGEGFEWANHSMFPVSHADVEDRVTIGVLVRAAYSASPMPSRR